MEVAILNASQSDCWEFSNSLCRCAYRIVYRDFKVAKINAFHLIQNIIICRHSKNVAELSPELQERRLFLYFIFLLSERNLQRYKKWKACHLTFVFFLLFTVHIRLMNWQFWPHYWENWLVCCVCSDCVSEWVCVCAQASVILLSLVCFKMFWEKNILRILRLVHSKESKRDFSNVFCKAEKTACEY